MKVPSLSHWQMDVVPFYTCCLWQDESSEDCEIYRFERRASQDCVGYQPPGAGLFQAFAIIKNTVKTIFLFSLQQLPFLEILTSTRLTT